MNRRGFFSFLAAAPVGIAAGATLKAEATAPNVVRAAPEYRCGCGSPLHHFIVVDDVSPSPWPGFSRGVPPSYYASRAVAVCSWCQAPWGGPTS